MCSFLTVLVRALALLLASLRLWRAEGDRLVNVNVSSPLHFAVSSNIVARQLRLVVRPERLAAFPERATDFALARQQGRWSASLDGPGERQTLALRSDGLAAGGLAQPRTSGEVPTMATGHSIAAPRGVPFECHHLELPVFLTDGRPDVSIDALAGPSALQIGDVVGTLTLEDFAIIGAAQASDAAADLGLRADRAPCSVHTCAIKSLGREASLHELGHGPTVHALERKHKLRIKAFAQSRAFLLPVLQACGDEAEVASFVSAGSRVQQEPVVLALVLVLCVAGSLML